MTKELKSRETKLITQSSLKFIILKLYISDLNSHKNIFMWSEKLQL